MSITGEENSETFHIAYRGGSGNRAHYVLGTSGLTREAAETLRYDRRANGEEIGAGEFVRSDREMTDEERRIAGRPANTRLDFVNCRGE